jgi:hypothetical protein
MDLIKYGGFYGRRMPALVAPVETVMVNDRRWTVDALGLPFRAGVRKPRSAIRLFFTIQNEVVALAVAGVVYFDFPPIACPFFHQYIFVPVEERQ